MKSAVQLDVVNAGNSEYDIYSVFARQQINDCFADFELFGRHLDCG